MSKTAREPWIQPTGGALAADVHGVAVVMDCGNTVGADPPQLRPVIGVVVDQQAHLRVPLDVGEPAQPLGCLGFGVDGCIDDVVVQREHHRHQMRPAVEGGGGQPGYRCVREAGLGVEFDHIAEPRCRS